MSQAIVVPKTEIEIENTRIHDAWICGSCQASRYEMEIEFIALCGVISKRVVGDGLNANCKTCAHIAMKGPGTCSVCGREK